MDENTKKFHKGSSTNRLNRILVFFCLGKYTSERVFLNFAVWGLSLAGGIQWRRQLVGSKSVLKVNENT